MSSSERSAELCPLVSSLATESLLRAVDWRATALGPVEDWSEDLLAAIRVVMPSRVPMLLWWGPGLVQIYNEASTRILGSKHPSGMGQRASECWAEVWEQVGPMVEGVVAGEDATYDEDLRTMINRHGFAEESYWTFSISPVHGRDGGVLGVLVATTETTAQVLSERRQVILHQLCRVSTADAQTAADTCRSALGVLERSPDVPFAMAYLLDETATSLGLLASFGVDVASMQGPTVKPGQDTGIPVWRVATSGRVEVVRGLSQRFGGPLGSVPLGEAAADDAVVAPLADRGREQPVGALVLGINPHRPLDGAYREFCELVASQVSTLLTDVLAYQAERRRTQAFAELDRARNRYVQNISHEFRTPLALLLGPLRAVLRGTGLDSPQPRGHHEDAETALRATLRLQRLVDSLLEVARSDAHRLRLRREPTDLAALTRDCASMFRSAIEDAGLRFDVEVSPVPGPVSVDREMWVRIVSNLLSNALKFTLRGRIGLRLSPCAEGARLTVTDTGVGIPAEELSRVFERFHQVPGVVGRTREGTGIGLSLVDDLVRAHGGEVAVDSAPGVGSAFTVTIPDAPSTGTSEHPTEEPSAITATFAAEAESWAATAATGAAGGSAAATSAAGTGAAGTGAEGAGVKGMGAALLVEDNADMRSYLTRLLEDDGWTVTAVADAASALAQAQRPDLLLTDVMLPGADGLELVRVLRANPDLSRVPIILLTARAGPDAVAEGLAAGADDYVVKPFDPTELLARLRVHGKLFRMRESAVAQADNRAANLLTALTSNRRIGTAIGILMNRHKVTEEDGFDLLRRASQALNRKLRDVADEVVTTGSLPPLGAREP